MTTTLLALLALSVLAVGYVLYGGWLNRRIVQPDDSRPVPAVAQRDGVDYEPAHPAMLFGHHFSTIAGAGPIIGPVLGVAWFGWGPVLLWILLGSIFLGGVHDFLSLIMSARMRGISVANIAGEVISRRAAGVFAVFLWVALVLVIAVFGVTAAKALMPSASPPPGGVDIGPAMVFPTFSIIVIAMLLGWARYRRGVPLWLGTVVALVLLGAAIYAGYRWVPITLTPLIAAPSAQLKAWFMILMGYCIIASLLPVWLLLQPRDYLSMYVLFACLAAGLVALLGAGKPLEASFFRGVTAPEGQPIWPFLFVVVACGAISGFHSVAATGTSVKQLPRESLARPIGYGAMLVEAALAVVALGAVAAGLSWAAGAPDSALAILGDKKGGGPLVAFARGYGNLLTQVFPFVSASFASLVGLTMLKTFVLTTLDSSTRLARFIINEYLGSYHPIFRDRTLATLMTVVPAFVLGFSGAWKKIWPVFGAANQLVAALTLLVITCWLLGTRKPSWPAAIPAGFMLVTTVVALGWQAVGFLTRTVDGQWQPQWLLGITAAVLTLLALFVAAEAIARVGRLLRGGGQEELAAQMEE